MGTALASCVALAHLGLDVAFRSRCGNFRSVDEVRRAGGDRALAQQAVSFSGNFAALPNEAACLWSGEREQGRRVGRGVLPDGRHLSGARIEQ